MCHRDFRRSLFKVRTIHYKNCNPPDHAAVMNLLALPDFVHPLDKGAAESV
jgi:hypothetical protein